MGQVMEVRSACYLVLLLYQLIANQVEDSRLRLFHLLISLQQLKLLQTDFIENKLLFILPT